MRRFPKLLAAAWGVRLCLLLFGAWQDDRLAVKYTDIDYSVFTDGAHLIVNRRSPFERPTYRYTPLLALLLTPNILIHEACGKLLFSAADLLIGAQIRSLLVLRHVPRHIADCSAALWLFNPLAINVSTRGNAESLVTALLLASLTALSHRRVLLSGMILGMAIHLKLYPVIYIPAFLTALGSDFGRSPAVAMKRMRLNGAFTAARVGFCVALGFTYAALAVVCYVWCGEAYIEEAVLYHLVRAVRRVSSRAVTTSIPFLMCILQMLAPLTG